ncbi:hypothetical protein D3H35_26165 [Cohnella faecalis]|uniref:Uncharacterized protein n=1 Tax=Cohnella faecalis TaxID=2315694 RepID=A0A398CE02_9BACL|nr:hypothetical protein D3H35_26165 [Cohnella faecalis]
MEAERTVGRAALDGIEGARRARAIVDGLIRDTKKILELGFPVFAQARSRSIPKAEVS